MATMSDRKTTFRCHDSVHYLCAELDGRIVADRTWERSWEHFTVVSIEPGIVALRSAHAKFVSALDEATCRALGLPPWSVTATADDIGATERWRPVQGDEGWGLLSYWDRFLVAEYGGGGAVLADRAYRHPGPWESFIAPGLGVPAPVPILDRLVVDPSRHYFATAAGRHDWREISAFALLALIQAGRHGEAETWVKNMVARRVTGGRVFATYTIGGIAGISDARPDRPNYWQAFDALIDMTGAAGFHLGLTVFAALEPFGAVWDPIARRGTFVGEVRRKGEAFAAEVAQRVSRHKHVTLQVANEPGHTGFRDLGDAVADVGRILSREAPETLVDAGDTTGQDLEQFFSDCFDSVDGHIDRNMEMRGLHGLKRMGETVWRDNQRRTIPGKSREPHNIGEWRRDGRNRDVVPFPIFAYAYGAMCRARQILPTFHFDGGLYCTEPQPITVECIEAWHRALDAFPMLDGNRWRGHHGLAAGDYWHDVWPNTDDVGEVERHIKEGRGPWRANGIGGWSTCFPEPKGWNWRAAVQVPVERVDHFEDNEFGVGIYRRTDQ